MAVLKSSNWLVKSTVGFEVGSITSVGADVGFGTSVGDVVGELLHAEINIPASKDVANAIISF
jgi:hypothetical protein